MSNRTLSSRESNYLMPSSLSHSIMSMLQMHADRTPEKLAIVSIDNAISYLDLLDHVHQYAQRINSKFLNQNTVLGVQSQDEISALIGTLACIAAGHSSVSIPSYEVEGHALSIAKKFKSFDFYVPPNFSKHNNMSGNFSTQEKKWPPKINQNPDIYFFTSGTTGRPKIVTHNSVTLATQAKNNIPINTQAFACISHIDFNFSKRHRLYCVASGVTNVFLKEGPPQNLVDQCLRHNVTMLQVTGFQAQQIASATNAKRLSGITLRIGGSHISEAMRRDIHKNVTPDLHIGYGTTESGAIAYANPETSQINTESVGRPLQNISVEIVDSNNQSVPANTSGLITVKLPGLFTSYHGEPDLTSRAINEGWFTTGDVGVIDEHGLLCVKGRADDMFIYNSINIYPQDIEAVIKKYDTVADVAVFPVSSAIHGEIPIAAIVYDPAKKSDPRKLERTLRSQLGLRCPKQFLSVHEIPRNATGKVLRKKLKIVAQGLQSVKSELCTYLQDRSTTDSKAHKILASLVSQSDVKLRHLGMSSLDVMELLVFIESRFNTVISPREYSQCRFMSELLSKISQKSDITNIKIDSSTEKHQEEYQNLPAELALRGRPVGQAPLRKIRLLQRLITRSQTATRLNQGLQSLADKLTPKEFVYLYENNSRILVDTQNNRRMVRKAYHDWLAQIATHMKTSNKTHVENFELARISSCLLYFTGPEEKSKKTLLICFSPRGQRRLSIPNCVLVQFFDARKYDILVVAEPRNHSYSRGIPLLGSSDTEVIRNISKLHTLSHYASIKTLGISAGAFMALKVGHAMNAKSSTVLSGLFHRAKRNPRYNLRFFIFLVKIRLEKRIDTINFYYAKGLKRDEKFAKRAASITGNDSIAIVRENGNYNHQFFEDLLTEEKLACFLEKTVLHDSETQGRMERSRHLQWII